MQLVTVPNLWWRQWRNVGQQHNRNNKFIVKKWLHSTKNDATQWYTAQFWRSCYTTNLKHNTVQAWKYAKTVIMSHHTCHITTTTTTNWRWFYIIWCEPTTENWKLPGVTSATMPLSAALKLTCISLCFDAISDSASCKTLVNSCCFLSCVSCSNWSSVLFLPICWSSFSRSCLLWSICDDQYMYVIWFVSQWLKKKYMYF